MNNNMTRLITRPVGNNLDNDENDVLSVKFALQDLNRFNPDDEYDGPNEFVTRPFDIAINSFQNDEGLKVDGVLFPEGETELRLGQRLDEQLEARMNAFSRPSPQPAESDPRDTIRPLPAPEPEPGNPITAQLLSESSEGDDGEGEDNEDGGNETPPADPPPAEPPKDPPSEPNEPDEKPDPNEPKPPKDPNKEEQEKKERCNQLSIDLQNEHLQLASINQEIGELGTELSEVTSDLNEAINELEELRGNRNLNMLLSGASRGLLGPIGAGVAYLDSRDEIKAAEGRVNQLRERLEALPQIIADKEQWLKDTKENIERLEEQIEDECRS